MKSQEILTGMLRDLGRPVGLYSNRDVETLNRRVAHEGELFLSVSLPLLDAGLLTGLETGLLPGIPGWKTKRHTSLPEFLYGYWSRVFSVDGSLLSSPDAYSIRVIRQVSRTFKKVFEVCSDDRVSSAVLRFKEVDRSLSQVTYSPRVDVLAEIAHHLFGQVVGESISASMTHRHGPGAVSEGLDSLERWSFKTISREVDELVGAEAFRLTWEDLAVRPPDINTIPARLVAVPKTALTPRLITVEPSYNQFLQQGLSTELRKRLSHLPVVNITDQLRNRKLALEGSRDGSLATLDLSDASDRLMAGLVRRVFGWNQSFVDWLFSTRSQIVQLPSGELTHVNKFAGMGSALTFPVQTMVFFAIVVLAHCESEGNFSRSFVRAFLTRGNVGVYGDDIIVPSAISPIVIRLLAEFGLKVNTSKSFSVGRFRESCGGDYYGGINVTPLYVRRNLPSSRHDVTELVSLSSFRNAWVSQHGEGELSAKIDTHISALIPYPAGMPGMHLEHGNVPDGVRGICKIGSSAPIEARWNPNLQRLEVKMMVPVSERKLTVWSSDAALFKTVYGGYNQDPRHLTHHGRPVSAKLKHRWVATP
jgi:hypothetical protein